MAFQSTLSVRRATAKIRILRAKVYISIHALRKESDLRQFQHERLHVISIHALRKESDPVYTLDPNHVDISIHALRKESDVDDGEPVNPLSVISIHALRKESDLPTMRVSVYG